MGQDNGEGSVCHPTLAEFCHGLQSGIINCRELEVILQYSAKVVMQMQDFGHPS